jgi:1-acyl-sn-glycerol-3-phosphate acyltransferase
MTDYSQIWLIFLATAVLVYAATVYLRSDYSTWESMLYLPAYLLTRLLWRVHFTNQAPLEMRAGAILAANHRSSIDPMFVQLAARRRVHWMVAKEYCQNFAFGPILRALQVIPTNRTGTDINSTKIAMRYASQNRLVGMFPEGRINTTRQPLLPVRAGAAMVAVKAGVPIIPIYIQGSPYLERFSVISPFLLPARVRVTFGKPIYPETECKQVNSREVESEAAVLGLEQAKDNSHVGNNRASDLISRWAAAIAELAGSPGFEAQVGSSAKRRNMQRQLKGTD